MKKQIYATYDNQISEREKRNMQIAYEAAAEGIVLLENKGVLPIQPQKIALYGIGAAINIKGGTGSGEVNERHCVSIVEGLENEGFEITSKNWLNDYVEEFERGKQAFGKDMMKRMTSGSADDKINIMANKYHYPFGRKLTEKELEENPAKNCIYVISRQAGECADRSLSDDEFQISDTELHNLRLACKYFENVIVVVNVGGTMDLSPLDEMNQIGAIIYFCQQGMMGAKALVDILIGKRTPSGCLTDTWVNSYADVPYGDSYSYLNGNTEEEYYKEGIFVGYRYYDSFQKKVRYPFGYGLSYTNFSIEPVSVKNEKSTIMIQLKVSNIGTHFSGKKVVQLYVSAPKGKLEKEYQSLAAFGKTKELEPGESEEITLSFDMKDVASYDYEKAAFVLEEGKYVLRAGASSRDTEIYGVIELKESVITEQCKNICQTKLIFEELNNRTAPYEKRPESDNIIIIDASDIETVYHNYEKNSQPEKTEIKSTLKKMTQDDKFRLLMGSGAMGNGTTVSVAGCASYTAAFPKLGIPDRVMCDGPVGLRLVRTQVEGKFGKLKPAEPMMEFLNYLPGMVKKMMLGNPKKGRCRYQYATAFPVGTALAQTWNMSLLEMVGDAVGVEMKEFGVTFWLAPGMNIHRNPLCGRNYEYYSEDPILSGKCAAAITRGVQQHKGKYVTLKHFCCNNQETQRNHVSSNLSERALREIYLKGFSVGVREANAKAVMTSYNRVNGRYASTWPDLCTTVLRMEWGFQGIVMTDWFSTGKGLGNNGETIKAGNDMIMPGGKEYIKALKQDLKNGKVSCEDIDAACERILNIILDS